VKRLLQTTFFMILLVVVLAALVWYGDANKIAAKVARFQRVYLAWFILLMLVHEIVRWALWVYLLRSLSIRSRPRAETFAFAAGEAAKFIPIGSYLQNYLLQRSTRTDFGRSSAATTLMIVSEIIAALVGVEVLGVGSWSLGLRIAIISLLVVGVLSARAFFIRSPIARRLGWLRRYKFTEIVAAEYKRFRAGTVSLVNPRVIGTTLLLSFVYVLISGAALYEVVRALSIGGVSFWQAVGVNCFGLAFYVILGSLEAADVGAFVGIGISKSAAVSAVLVNRGLGIGVTIALSLIVMALLHDEWQALHFWQSEPAATARSSEAAGT
jgi:hypothetical protein